MKHVPPEAFLQGIAIPGLAPRPGAPIVVDAAGIIAAALVAARAKRGGK